MSVEKVHQASDWFYAAHSRYLADACSHADDVSAMHPLGDRQLGWPEVRAA